MDETGRRTNVVSGFGDLPLDVQIFILEFMTKVRDINAKVYLTGGALQDRPIKDYDILVSCTDNESEIWELCYEYGQPIPIYDEADDRWHTILKPDTLSNVDILVSDSKKHEIKRLLDDYPLSIQMRALDLTTGELIVGSKFNEDVITVYSRGSAELKYREYYPTKEFVYAV